jgi:hypothetical protein
MIWETLLVLVLVLWAVGKGWRYFVEVSEDFQIIRTLEPWFWFFFLNVFLSFVTGNFEYRFLYIGLLLQVVLCAWFAISISWIVQSCPHKHFMAQPSWFVPGKNLRFCVRCGTRLPREIHSDAMKLSHPSLVFFQIPPALFKYVLFWMFHSLLTLVAVFLALRMVKNPDLQNDVAVAALALIVLVPLALFFLGRFKRSLNRREGLIKWEDIRGYGLIWVIVAVILFIILQWIASS